MGKIVCGFAGIGKSSAKEYRPDIRCYDLDSTHFKKQDGWEDVYIDCALGLCKIYDYVFLTTYTCTLKRLNERKIEWFLIYPKKELKSEYYNRYISRENRMEFADDFISKWDENINELTQFSNDNKIILDKGEYLSDVIDRI